MGSGEVGGRTEANVGPRSKSHFKGALSDEEGQNQTNYLDFILHI